MKNKFRYQNKIVQIGFTSSVCCVVEHFHNISYIIGASRFLPVVFVLILYHTLFTIWIEEVKKREKKYWDFSMERYGARRRAKNPNTVHITHILHIKYHFKGKD